MKVMKWMKLKKKQKPIDAVVNDTEPVVKPEQAMVVTKILEAIYQSAKSGKAIYFE